MPRAHLELFCGWWGPVGPLALALPVSVPWNQAQGAEQRSDLDAPGGREKGAAVSIPRRERCCGSEKPRLI